jgi:uncharacterized protein YjiS (DUF1127 family)
MLETGMASNLADHPLRAEAPPHPGRLTAWIDCFLDWRDRVRQRRHLGALSSHMLKDIGLSTAEVEAELSKSFW